MRRQSSFTLIEILTVIAIVAILAAIVMSLGTFASNKANTSKTIAKLTALTQGIENCKLDRGYYPNTSLVSDSIVQLGKHEDTAVFKYDTPAAVGSTSLEVLTSGKFKNLQTGRNYLDGYSGGDYLDAWGQPFLYRCDGSQHNTGTFDLWSVGRDGKDGTEDDVTNWKRN
jgi:general secretion pathway protein G